MSPFPGVGEMCHCHTRKELLRKRLIIFRSSFPWYGHLVLTYLGLVTQSLYLQHTYDDLKMAKLEFMPLLFQLFFFFFFFFFFFERMTY